MRVFTTICQSMFASLCFIILFTEISDKLYSYIEKFTNSKVGMYITSIFLLMCWFGVVGTILG